MDSLKRVLLKYQEQNHLNHELRRLVEHEGIKAAAKITDLIEKGADPNYRDEFRESLIFTVLYNWPFGTQVAGIELLTSSGANVNLPGDEGKTALYFCLEASYPTEIGELLLSKGAVPIESKKMNFIDAAENCRYGTANPERIGNSYYDFMIATGVYASSVGGHGLLDGSGSGILDTLQTKFEELTRKARSGELPGETAAGMFNALAFGKPKWCNQRYGRTFHFLEDGTMLQIGGEHEDFSDPDFHIYNDVINLSPKGEVQLYLYPKDIFPPTDFHTSTKIGNDIMIIGALGYREDRIEGHTNMHVLNLDDFSIKSIPSSGDNPGWIFEHITLWDEEDGCLYVLGGRKWNNGKLVDNDETYRFTLSTRIWSRID